MKLIFEGFVLLRWWQIIVWAYRKGWGTRSDVLSRPLICWTDSSWGLTGFYRERESKSEQIIFAAAQNNPEKKIIITCMTSGLNPLGLPLDVSICYIGLSGYRFAQPTNGILYKNQIKMLLILQKCVTTKPTIKLIILLRWQLSLYKIKIIVVHFTKKEKQSTSNYNFYFNVLLSISL